MEEQRFDDPESWVSLVRVLHFGRDLWMVQHSDGNELHACNGGCPEESC
jgi:hypothetical protein